MGSACVLWENFINFLMVQKQQFDLVVKALLSIWWIMNYRSFVYKIQATRLGFNLKIWRDANFSIDGMRFFFFFIKSSAIRRYWWNEMIILASSPQLPKNNIQIIISCLVFQRRYNKRVNHVKYKRVWKISQFRNNHLSTNSFGWL